MAGTIFDLTPVAVIFGISTMMLSGMVWLIISIIICAGVYKISDTSGGMRQSSGGKVVFFVFYLCIVIGAVLGMLPVLVAGLIAIGFGVVVGYPLFFRGANY